MGKIVLLAVAAAWAAVLIPPLIRSRVENRPNSSVTDFRRQLSTLQRTVPTRGMAPMRTIGRPLTQAPSSRPATRRAGATCAGGDRPIPPPRRHARPAGAHRAAMPSSLAARRRVRCAVAGAPTCCSSWSSRSSAPSSAFAMTKTDVLMYAFVLSFFSLMGYCYKLVQLRNERARPPTHDGHPLVPRSLSDRVVRPTGV